MLDDRKAAILKAVVEEYIQTAQPVGSGAVSRHSDLSVSSATVRNEMGVLEREGYLAQPHTSAGRIPTDKGYRFFVDSIAGPGRLGPAQAQQIRAFFATAHGELERMLADTSRFLSGLTDYAAVVDPPGRRSCPHPFGADCQPGSPGGGRGRGGGNGAVDKHTVEIPDEPSEAQVAAASVHLAGHLTGASLGRLPAIPPTDDAVVDRVVGMAEAALRHGGRGSSQLESNAQVFVGGAARMAAAFDAVTTIREVLGILEQQFVLVTLIRDVLDRGLTVAIGTEHGVQPLSDCSIVVAPYEVEGERAGTVGILGPTRMHYEHALAAVAVVGKRLGQALSEGTGTGRVN